MASSAKSTSLCFSITVVFFLCSSNFCFSSEPTPTPTPTPWPHQFHAVLFVNNSGLLRKTDLWYDWVNGRNFNILQKQLGELLYGLEWNNGTSFYYTLDESKKCRIMQFGVGILRPNWLEGAEYLGQRVVDGFLCNVWQKVDFVWYYEDVGSKRPVYWVFYDGMESHVMTYEVGAVLEDQKWQAPVYCFNKARTEDDTFGGVSERMWLDPFLQERRRDS